MISSKLLKFWGFKMFLITLEKFQVLCLGFLLIIGPWPSLCGPDACELRQLANWVHFWAFKNVFLSVTVFITMLLNSNILTFGFTKLSFLFGNKSKYNLISQLFFN